MEEEKGNKFLTVAPFQCAWRKDLKFREAGRGCVSFDAFAHNDVTVVFRENVGSLHYHYKRDNSPHYTVILGSNRNRRLKIEADGKTEVDVEGIGLCSSAFQSYWISIYDGLISVGKGRYPFQNTMFQWLHSSPNCNVRYVGLSSWDRHVGYRNVNVLPLPHDHMLLWKQVDSGEFEGKEDSEDEELETKEISYEKWGLHNFLESWELSDVFFIVGVDERPVPAHKIILQASGSFPFSSTNEDVIQLKSVSYTVMHTLLQYIYTGRTQVLESQVELLLALSSQFEVMPLARQCEELLERCKVNKKLFGTGNSVELCYPNSRPHSCTMFPAGLPVNQRRLSELHSACQYSDLNIFIEGYGLVAQPHKVIISLWSVPFAKMFTNGMSESSSPEVHLKDVPVEAFKIMLDFMYSGELNLEDTADAGTLLLQLLLLADQFGVTVLYQECCKTLLECLSEDAVCPILQVVSSISSCKLVEETCERKFAMQFDYCTTAGLDFILLDEATFSNIIQHQDLTVTSEEKVLNAILMWCIQAKELYGWETVDELIACSSLDLLSSDRLQSLNDLLPFVRFPLLPHSVLKKLEQSNLCKHIPILSDLVREAISYLDLGLTNSNPGKDLNLRFQHRRSSYKELQYICNGDSNGVLYFAGTSYGQHQWVNPVLSKRICITASSPASRYTDPKALASRSYQGMCFAGPRMEDGLVCSWWMVDLGQDHQLMCNYYTLRLDGSRAFMRSWRLQGSLDGKTWTDLRAHNDDQTMSKPGQFASWPVTGPNALLPFRFFRVVLTSPTTDVSNPWNLCICFLELYGFFR